MNPQDKVELFAALQVDEIAARTLHNELSRGSLYDLSYSGSPA